MPDYRALAQALGTSQPTPQEIERMAALQSPAFGVFPQMQPYRSQQDITASANVPVDLLRGRVAGTRGLFGDVVNQPIPMVRPLQLLSQAFTGQQKYPDTEHYLDTMPLKSDTPIGDVAGRIGSFAPINPMPAVRAGQKGLNMLGMEVADRLATGRSVLPSLLKEPQTAMFAVNPADQMAQAVTKAEVSPLGFYSAVEQQALKIPRKQGTGDSFLNDLMKGQDVKKYEIEAMGLDTYLKGKPNVTRQEVQDFIATNKLDVQERQLGENIAQDPIGIAKRKEIFDKYDPQIQALDNEKVQYAIDIVNARNLAKKNYAEANAALNRENLFGSQPIPTTEDWNRYYLANAELEKMNKIPLDTREFERKINALRDARDAEANAAYVVPEPTPTKYEKYQLPGGENYRELLLTLPNKPMDAGMAAENYYTQFVKRGGEPDWSQLTPVKQQEVINSMPPQARNASASPDYRSSHFDEPNILAHMRVNDRVDAEGKKMLLIEEVQSDWHQAGRERGYKTKESLEKWYNQNKLDNDPAFADLNSEQRSVIERNRSAGMGGDNAVPDAPFKDTWHQLALKRAIKEAVDKGYDRIGLTTGAQQAARYDLSKQIDLIDYRRSSNNTFELGVVGKNGETVDLPKRFYTAEELPSVLGKEVADKIVKGEGQKGGGRTTLRGLDLQVGGEGMKKYYDEVYPNYLNKLGKKYGAQVGETNVKTQTGEPAFVDYIVGPGNFNDTTVLGLRPDGTTAIVNQNANSMEEAQQLANRYKEKHLGGGQEKVRYLDITPEMRKAIKEGQPLASIEEELAKALA